MSTVSGERWKLLREGAGLSQRKAEEAMGWKRGHLSWIERGIDPTPAQERDMRRLYGGILLAEGEAS